MNILVLIFVANCFLGGLCNEDAKRLFDDLLKNYNKLGRPVRHNGERITIQMKLRLSQIIDVHEKDQIMTTSVWLKQEWTDYKLSWDSSNYGGVRVLYVPAEMIWLPDIVLYNNADSNYNITILTKATVHSNGTVHWEPPAVYKSMCQINVEWFPFDEQTCHLKFGSWTYDSSLLDLVHMNENGTVIEQERYDGTFENVTLVWNGIDLDDYYPSVEWEILEIPARKHNRHYQSCCPEMDKYADITYSVTLRRKPLFYTVNLIFPCCGVSFLTILVFYLPSDSGEKITLSISILVCLTVFFLLLTEIIPATSIVLPLIGKYLLFTMMMVTINVMVTVVALNVHFRTPTTHVMPKWVKTAFLEFLPKYLLMSRPMGKGDNFRRFSIKYDSTTVTDLPLIQEPPEDENCRHPLCQESIEDRNPTTVATAYNKASSPTITQKRQPKKGNVHFLEIPTSEKNAKSRTVGRYSRQAAELEALYKSPPVLQAFENVCFIAELLKKQDKDDRIDEDWKYVAKVVDRLFLVIFAISCVFGTLIILLRAPSFRDTRVACQPFCEEQNIVQAYTKKFPTFSDIYN